MFLNVYGTDEMYRNVYEDKLDVPEYVQRPPNCTLMCTETNWMFLTVHGN